MSRSFSAYRSGGSSGGNVAVLRQPWLVAQLRAHMRLPSMRTMCEIGRRGASVMLASRHSPRRKINRRLNVKKIALFAIVSLFLSGAFAAEEAKRYGKWGV